MARYPDNLIIEAIPDRFEVLERLGSGAFGTVFRVFDTEYQTFVALKALSQVAPSHLYHFKQEFRSLADLSHPNLIDLYELFATEDIWFFTMDCIDGVDFKEAVIFGVEPASSDPLSSTLDPPATLDGRGGALAAAETMSVQGPRPTPDGQPPETKPQPPADPCESSSGESSDDPRHEERPAAESAAALFPIDEDFLRETFAELVRGVTALHGYGMLHRDLKPGNVLVTPDGRVVILDFGLVANLDGADALEKRRGSGSDIVGTPRYLAPELVTESPVTEASDRYSLGVMLYEVLTGRPPFIGQSTLQELFRKNSEPPTPVTEYRPDVSTDLADVCMALLDPDPTERPSGPEVLERLGEAPGHSPGVNRLGADPQDDRQADRPLVGRTEQLDRLWAVAEEIFEDGEPTRPAVVHVFGGSGVGKSTLVSRFLDTFEACREDALVLRARCYENESVPYKAFDGVVDALLPWLEQLPEAQLREYLGDRTNTHAIGQLFPVLRRLDAVFMGGLETGELSEAQLRNRGFEALGNLLSALADHHRLVVYIDDAQWGDEDSVLLLEHVLNRDDPPGMMLVTTWREADADSSPFLVPFRELLGHAPDSVTLEDIELSALDDRAARQLAENLARSDDRLDIDAIVRESRGNPFFVVELARHLADVDKPRAEVTSLDDLLAQRIDHLPDHARRLLETIAVAGHPIDSQLIREASAADSEDLASLSLLQSDRLIRRPAGNSSKLATYHDRIRETVLDRLDEATAARLHLDLARTLESNRAPDPETLAYHYEAAGEGQRAAEYMIDAAEAAAEGLAFERAVQLLSDALNLGDWPKRRRFELHRRLGELLAALGLVERSTEAYLRAAELTGGLDASDCRIRACEQALRAGQIDQGVELLYEELETLGFSPTANRPAMLASILYQRWRLQRRGFDHQPSPPEELDRRERLLLDALTVATTMFGVIDMVRSTYFHYHGLHRALETGYPSRLVALLCQQAAQAAASGEDPQRAQHLLETAESLLPECRQERENLRAYRIFIGGMVDYFQGRWRPAAAAFERAIQIIGSRCPGFVWETEVFQYFKLDCLQWLGQIATIKAELPRELELSVERGDSFHSVLYRTKGAFLKLTDDRPGEADQQVELARREWKHEHYSVQHFRILEAAVRTAMYRGDAERAWSLVSEDWGQLRRSLLLETEETRQNAWSLYGRAAVTLQARAGGLRSVKLGLQTRRAIAKLRDTPDNWAAGFADAIEARRATNQGDDAEAARLLAVAERRFRDHEMHFHAESARLWRGRIAHGAEADQLEASARAWMEEQGVVDPIAMASTAIPF